MFAPRRKEDRDIIGKFPALARKSINLFSVLTGRLDRPYPGEPENISSEGRAALWAANYSGKPGFQKKKEIIITINISIFILSALCFVLSGMFLVCYMLSPINSENSINELTRLSWSASVASIFLIGGLISIPAVKFLEKLSKARWELKFGEATCLLRKKSYLSYQAFHDFVTFFNSAKPESFARVLPDDIVMMVRLSGRLTEIAGYADNVRHSILLDADTLELLSRVKEAMTGYDVAPSAVPAKIVTDTREIIQHHVSVSNGDARSSIDRLNEL